MTSRKFTGLAVALALGTSTAAHAVPTEEWASALIGYSSQWSSSSWSAAQTLGTPDTFGYGDIRTSWAPSSLNATLEYVSVGYATPTYSSGALVRETDGNGFVYQIDVIDMSDSLHTVWAGVDPSMPGTPVDFMPTWAPTPYLVKGLKIYVNTNHAPVDWEEIDAIKLIGDSVAPAVPEPSSALLMALGAVLIGGFLRQRRG